MTDATSRARKLWLSERALQTMAVAMETDEHWKDWIELAETASDALKYHGFQIIDTRTHVAVPREPSEEMVERVGWAIFLCGLDITYREQARVAIAAMTQGGDDGKDV